jgi:hypothetical protein
VLTFLHIIRLFRRGSRAGTDVAEDDPGNPFSPPTGPGSPTKQTFTQSLDTATFSNLQRQRPAGSPVQVMTSDEERETEEALTKYDFLDLMTDTSGDRMEQQRSPLPPALHKQYSSVPRYKPALHKQYSSVPRYKPALRKQYSSVPR